MAGFTDWTPPSFSPTTIPALPALSLSEDERGLIGFLQSRYRVDQHNMVLTNSYYMGAQAIDNLKIAIPDALAQRLRTLVGWARIAVDPYVERLHVEGFRLPGATDVDADLGDWWALNGLDSEESLAYTDALSMGRGYWLLGSDDELGVRCTVESPLNVAVQWDTTGRRATSAMQHYKHGDEERAALYLPDRTMFLALNERKEWVIDDVDPHNFGYVPLVRMANNPRTDNRDGFSEITPELISVIDDACRISMGMSAASELYSVPRMLILGASAEDFQDANGSVRKAWDAYVNKINFLEADEEGNVPTVTQLTAYDPSVFTKVLEHKASQAAGILAAVPQDLGLYTEGNPVSAEAWNATETRRNRRAATKQRAFGVALGEVIRMKLRFENNGQVPDKYRRLEIDWMNPEVVSMATAADAISKQVAAGSVPPTSDVTLKRLGYNAVERLQLERDRGEQVSGDIVAALQNAATTARAPQPQAAPQQVTGDAGVQS